MYSKLVIGCMLLMGMMLGGGCTKLQVSNASACLVPFDYADEGVNEQNARALLMYYCVCKDARMCK